MFKKLAFGTAGLLLLVSPLVSSAQTISVQALIDALLQQIAQLQTQIDALRGQSTTPSVSSSQCLNLANALVIGSTDATTNGEVSKLQQFLIAAGVYPEARTTGYYGLLTAQAVVRWQKAHGMDFVTTRSGVGPMTRQKLACSAGYSSPSITSISPSSGTIGTVVAVRGTGLVDPRGNTALIFEKADGSQVRLWDTLGYENTQGTLIRAVVKEPCQQGEMYLDHRSESGISSLCNYIALTPGQYKVYFAAYVDALNRDDKSNVVTFTIN